MSQTPKQPLYLLRNWREYNRALVNRGSLTIWVDRHATHDWPYWTSPPMAGAGLTVYEALSYSAGDLYPSDE